jgi:hypothetical protein
VPECMRGAARVLLDNCQLQCRLKARHIGATNEVVRQPVNRATHMHLLRLGFFLSWTHLVGTYTLLRSVLARCSSAAARCALLLSRQRRRCDSHCTSSNRIRRHSLGMSGITTRE